MNPQSQNHAQTQPDPNPTHNWMQLIGALIEVSTKVLAGEKYQNKHNLITPLADLATLQLLQKGNRFV